MGAGGKQQPPIIRGRIKLRSTSLQSALRTGNSDNTMLTFAQCENPILARESTANTLAGMFEHQSTHLKVEA
jgi:hypothetical protein